MKKNIIFIIFISFINSAIYCSVFEKIDDLKLLESAHFDIVFDDESYEEAFLVYNNCEIIYKEITQFFNIDRNQHFNVAITSDIDSFNAYFSIYPSPHIVLYNTISVNNNFNVFSSDYILNVFKHELTHALTLSGKNNFIRNTFSQILNNSFFNITIFNAEGFAVLSESQNGEGRLNNNLYKSRILEAKAENKFLKYNEVQGNRDIYPTNIFYLYGAFFNQYLVKTYGIEKYREYIKQLHNFNPLFLDPNSSFLKIYNLDLYNVYNDFENSFVHLELESIDYKTYDYLPTSILTFNDKILVYQKRNNSIRDIDTNEKIISLLNNPYFISANNNNIVLSTFSKKNLDVSTTLVIDENNNKQKYVIPNFKMAIKYNNFLVGIYNNAQQQYIAFYRDGKVYKKIRVEDNEFIQKIDIINGELIYLSRYQNIDRINFIIDDNTRETYFFKDKNIEIIDFSISKRKLILSTVKDNQLARLSFIDLNTKKAYINNFDTLGGVFNPILDDDNVYYIAKLAENNELRNAKLSEFNFMEEPLYIEKTVIREQTKLKLVSSKVKKYNKFEYILDGSFFPFILPNDNVDGAILGGYFESIVPCESLKTKLLYQVNLYEDFYSSLKINFSNITGNKETSLNINYSTLYKNILNTSILAIQFNHFNSFDLINNQKLFFKTSISEISFDNYFSDFDFGYYFSTNIGPKKENYLYFDLSYSPQISYSSYNNSFSYNNIIKSSIYIPYLLPFINSKNATLNMPFKVNYSYNINDKKHDLELSLLVFKTEVQKSFERIPIYLNNIEAYINYNFNKNEIALYSIFTSGLTQSSINRVQLYPGFNYTYNFDDNSINYNISFYTNF